jgi:hypothetical protein
VDIATFRADFPEFADVGAYPNAQVTFYLTLAGKLLNACRWADLLDMGTELFVAHNLVLERQNQAAAATGGVPGVQTGAVSGKTVDKVSVTYDASAGLETDAGHWNLTTYGTRFINLARMVGAGGMQF